MSDIFKEDGNPGEKNQQKTCKSRVKIEEPVTPHSSSKPSTSYDDAFKSRGSSVTSYQDSNKSRGSSVTSYQDSNKSRGSSVTSNQYTNKSRGSSITSYQDTNKSRGSSITSYQDTNKSRGSSVTSYPHTRNASFQSSQCGAISETASHNVSAAALYNNNETEGSVKSAQAEYLRSLVRDASYESQPSSKSPILPYISSVKSSRCDTEFKSKESNHLFPYLFPLSPANSCRSELSKPVKSSYTVIKQVSSRQETVAPESDDDQGIITYSESNQDKIKPSESQETDKAPGISCCPTLGAGSKPTNKTQQSEDTEEEQKATKLDNATPPKKKEKEVGIRIPKNKKKIDKKAHIKFVRSTHTNIFIYRNLAQKLERLEKFFNNELEKIQVPKRKPFTPYIFNDLRPYCEVKELCYLLKQPDIKSYGFTSRPYAFGIVNPEENLALDRLISTLKEDKKVDVVLPLAKIREKQLEKMKNLAKVPTGRERSGSTSSKKSQVSQRSQKSQGNTKRLSFQDNATESSLPKKEEEKAEEKSEEKEEAAEEETDHKSTSTVYL